MGIEAILGEQRNRKNTAFISFRELGCFYAGSYLTTEAYTHPFAAIAGKRGEKKKVESIKREIKKLDELKRLKINDNTSLGFDDKVAAFEIVQIEAPNWFGSDDAYSTALRKQGKLGKGEKARSPILRLNQILKGMFRDYNDRPEFFTGHYKKTADMRIGPVGAVYELDKSLADVLKQQTEINLEYMEIGKQVSYKHKLGGALAKYDGTNPEVLEEGMTKKDKKNLSHKIKQFADKLVKLNKNLAKIGKAHIEYYDAYGFFDIHFDFDVTESTIPEEERKWIKFKRMRDLDEILSDTATNFDIEKFEYDSDEERVDMIVMFNMKSGKIKNKKIFIRYPTKKKKINGFEVEYCGSAEELVKKSADFVNGKQGDESFILSAYYIPFDAIQMREEGKFIIGERGSDPKKEVSIKFFEKIGVYGKHILDPHDIAKTLFDHLPNQKMDIIGKVLGIGGKTGITSYRQGREISIMIRTGEIDHLSSDTLKLIKGKLGKDISDLIKEKRKEVGNDILIEYTTGDGMLMGAIQQHEIFVNALEDRVFMSKLFKVDPFKIFHDPSRVNDGQDRSYFENVGVQRDNVYRRLKVMIDYERKSMIKFNKFNFSSFKKPFKRGMFSNVYKVYVPQARFLVDQISKNFPDILKLIEYTDQFSDDPLRQADIARHEDRLCKLMIQDYAICMRERDNLENAINKVKKEYKILNKSSSISGSFKDKVYQTCSSIGKMIKDNFKNDKTEENQKNLRRYLDYNATQDLLKEWLDETDANFLEKEKISIRDFQSMFNQFAKLQDKERKVYGNYGVRAFANQYDKSVASIEEALDRREFEVYKFILENNLDLLHIQNNYIYLKGDKKAFSKKDCPVFLVDEIETALMTAKPSDQRNRDKDYELDQKIYYKKHGFYEGMTIKEEATNRMTMFERDTFGSFIETMLQGDYKQALEIMFDGLYCLNEGKVPNKDLVWFSKSSGEYKAYENDERISFADPQKVDEFKPDLEVYKRIFNKRARDLLEPFVGAKYLKFVENPNENIISDKEIKEMVKNIKIN